MRRTTLTYPLALILLCGCGAASSANPPPTPAPSNPAALSCTSSGAASAAWTAPWLAGTAPGIVSATAAGDTLKLTFASGTPEFAVIQTTTANFPLDPSGRMVELAGNSGVRIVLRGFRGDVNNYTGPARLTSSGPIVLEVGKTGDFEGVVSFGVGVSRSACANVTASGSTLTFHFIAAP